MPKSLLTAGFAPNVAEAGAIDKSSAVRTSESVAAKAEVKRDLKAPRSQIIEVVGFFGGFAPLIVRVGNGYYNDRRRNR